MAVNAVNARAQALALIKAQVSAASGLAYNSYGTSNAYYPNPTVFLLGSYRIQPPVSNNLYRPEQIIYPAANVAEADAWTAEIISDHWRSCRHVLSRLEHDYQAAALLVFTIRTNKTILLSPHFRALYAPYYDGGTPPAPVIGPPLLALEMARYQYNGALQTRLTELRQREALYFFNLTINTGDTETMAALNTRFLDNATWP
jgi:hypothetical protein